MYIHNLENGGGVCLQSQIILLTEVSDEYKPGLTVPKSHTHIP